MYDAFNFRFSFRWQKTDKRLMDGGFLELNAEETEAEVEEFSREMYKLSKVFTTKAKQLKKDRDLGGGVRGMRTCTHTCMFMSQSPIGSSRGS